MPCLCPSQPAGAHARVCVLGCTSVWPPRRGPSPATGRIRCLAAQRMDCTSVWPPRRGPSPTTWRVNTHSLGSVGKGLPAGAVNAKHGHDVAGLGLLNVLHLVAAAVSTNSTQQCSARHLLAGSRAGAPERDVCTRRGGAPVHAHEPRHAHAPARVGAGDVVALAHAAAVHADVRQLAVPAQHAQHGSHGVGTVAQLLRCGRAAEEVRLSLASPKVQRSLAALQLALRKVRKQRAQLTCPPHSPSPGKHSLALLQLEGQAHPTAHHQASTHLPSSSLKARPTKGPEGEQGSTKGSSDPSLTSSALLGTCATTTARAPRAQQGSLALVAGGVARHCSAAARPPRIPWPIRSGRSGKAALLLPWWQAQCSTGRGPKALAGS